MLCASSPSPLKSFFRCSVPLLLASHLHKKAMKGFELMAQMQIQNDRVTLKGVHYIRPFTLAGVIGSLLFVFGFTIDGFLRPGYSPIHQVVSDLGIGENAWILNTDLVVFGLLFMLFAIGFYQAMLKLIGGGEVIGSTFLFLVTGGRAMERCFFAEVDSPG